MEIFNHWAFNVIDLVITTYLVYYWYTNESAKNDSKR